MITMEDRLSILEVIANYSYSYDSLDGEGFANLFTEDAVWEFYVVGKEEPEISLVSQDEIRDWAIPRLRDRVGKFSSRHHQTNTVFDLSSTKSITTRTMVLVTHHHMGDPHPTNSLSGEYHDTWKKTAQGWKFAKRILFADKYHS